MSESLVVIRTFQNLLQADEAQIELLNAGIYSLVMSDDDTAAMAAAIAADAVALAVHRRDAEIASAVLAPTMDTEQSADGE